MPGFLRPGRLLLFLVVIGVCAAGLRGSGPAPPAAQPLLSGGAPLVLCGPEAAWPALGTFQSVAPQVVAWARQNTRDLNPGGHLAVVLLPGARWYGCDPCREGMQKVVDQLEQQLVETGRYPESLPPTRLGGCELTYRCSGDDFELDCSNGLHYSSLEGFTASESETAVLYGDGPTPEVRGLDANCLSAHRELLDRIWQETLRTDALEFHLEGAPLGPLAGDLTALEGRCLSDRLELQGFVSQPAHREFKPSREALLQALSGLPAQARFGLAVEPGLLPRLPRGLSLTSLTPVEQRHIWDNMQALAQGALALGADWKLDDAEAVNRLRTGRAAVWGSLPLSSNQAGMEFLNGSPVVRRRVELENLASARVQGQRLDLALGAQLPAGPQEVKEDVFPKEMPGTPGAAGWLEVQRGARTQILRWAAGPSSSGLWLVADITAGEAAPPEPPELQAGQLDPDAATDSVAWDD